jgi:glycosyltransferase involved in cell wall biosynthesis
VKVLLINTFDRGGAANACLRLHEGLLKEGIDSSLLLKYKTKNILNSFEYNTERRKSVFSKLNLKIKNYLFSNLNRRKKYKRDPRLEYFSYPETKIDITETSIYKQCDIIHLHWIADFVDYESFFKKNKKPVVWTLHDMSPFLGGEHYNEEYLGIDESGNPIKRNLTKLEALVFQDISKLKKRYLSKIENLHLVALNDWMINMLKSSFLAKRSVSKINNGIDVDNFFPLNKSESRRYFGLPVDKRIVLFVADFIDSNRKGFNILLKTIDLLSNENITFCVIGSSSCEIKKNNLIYLGKLESIEEMRQAYSTADLFVIPSLIDNQPNTIVESQLCGVPTIGFNKGGVSEMIINGLNGYVVEKSNSEALAKKIKSFFKNDKKFDRNKIRDFAQSNYDSKIQSQEYIKLYKSLYDNNKSKKSLNE